VQRVRSFKNWNNFVQKANCTFKNQKILRSFEKVAYNYVYDTMLNCGISIMPKS
jgi:hypothetical protein